MTRYVYTSAQLRSFNSRPSRPFRPVRKQLFKFRLWRPLAGRVRYPIDQRSVHCCDDGESDEKVNTSPSAGRINVETHQASEINYDNLSVASLNIRSVNNKFTFVADTLLSLKLDLFIICESWHQSRSDVALLKATPAGYDCIEEARPCDDLARSYGGIVAFYRNTFKVKKIDLKMKLQSFECVCFSMATSHGPLAVLAIYRPGSSPITDQFFTELATVLETLVVFKLTNPHHWRLQHSYK